MILLPDAAATQAWAGRLAVHLRDRGPECVVIGLSGDLGAGKTTFAQGFVAGLAPGRDLYVTSPTFAIAQSYDTEPPVRHLDLYRLEDFDELAAIGYRELFYAPGFALVEWIENVPEAVPEERVSVRLTVLEDDSRRAELVGHGAALRGVIADFPHGII